MKSVTKFLIVMAMLGLCSQLYSQNMDPATIKNENPVGQNDKSSGSSGDPAQSSSSHHQNYLFLGQECGMYLCEKWKSGSFELRDGTTFQDRMIRYNIYTQQMEYAWQGDTAAIGNPKDLAKLTLGDKTFVYREFICHNKVRQGYLELLVEGKYELLLHRGIKYVYKDNPHGTGKGGPVTKYYQDNRYFVSCNGEIAEQLPDRKNKIIALFEQDEKELKKYIQENKCKLKNQDELMNFFVFVNNN